MKIQIFDSLGNELQIGDMVMLQDYRNYNLTFYTKIQVQNGRLYPLHFFCFNRIILVESIPNNCSYVAAKDNTPEYWIDRETALKQINEQQLKQWITDYVLFQNNNFIKIIE
jgi:hypothetical protein